MTNATPQEKIRAIFLAALMVLSVFGMSAAFAGSAAAAVNTATATDVTVGQDSTIQTVTVESDQQDGGTAVTFEVDVSAAVNAGATVNDATAGANADSAQYYSSNDTVVIETTGLASGTTASADIDWDTSQAGTGSLSFTVDDGSGTTADATFNAVGADGVGVDSVDVSAGEETALINVSHSDRANVNELEVAIYGPSGLVQTFTAGSTSADVVSVGTNSATNTTFEVDLSDSNGQAFELGDYEVYAAAKSADDSFGTVDDQNFQVSDTFSVDGLTVTDFQGEDGVLRVAANDTVVEYDVSVNNTGSQEVTQNVEVVSTAAGASPWTGPADTAASVASQEVTVAPGENQTVTLTFNTGDLPGADQTAQEFGLAGFTSGSPYSAQTANLLTGSNTEGSLTISVVDQNSAAQENVDVDLYLEGDYDAGPVISSKLTNADGRVTFNGLAVGQDNNNQVRYVAEAAGDAVEFESTTTTLGLFEPTQTSDSSTVTLRSALEPQNISMGAFANGQIVGNTSTLLADGDVDNTATYAVFSQTQSNDLENQPINQEVSVDLSTAGSPDIARFVDENGNDAGKTLTVTIDENSPTFTMDGERYSYTTFRVSAAGANESTMTTGGVLNPNLINQLLADAGTDVANDATASAEIQYVLEGDEAITGEVVNRDGMPVENATVWAAYQGSNQSLAFSQETFVSDDGTPFLSAETDADGRYVIPGIAGDNTDVTIYAVAQGYNRLNLTDTTVGRFVAADEFEQTAGPDAKTENHDMVLSRIEVVTEYRLNVTAADEDGNFADSISMPIQNQRDVRVELEVKAENEPDSEFTPIENSTLVASEDVDFSLSNPAVGNVANDPLTVTQSGETTTFTSTRSVGTTTLTANVTNDEDTVFNDSVEIEVFGVGEITGQVVNDEDPASNLPGADVQLFRVEGGEEILEQTDVTGPEGSYSFTEVRTGETYRVVATFQNETGFTELDKTSAGTSNADVVIVGVTPDEANFQVSGLSPTDVTVTQGDQINVSATITNTGDQFETQTVEFRVGGSTIASQDVSLVGDENVTVEFTNIDTSGLAADDYTHGVYTDDDQQEATLTVEASNGGTNGTAWFDSYVDDNDVVTSSGLNAAVSDYLGGDLSDQRFNAVVSSFISGSPIQA